MNEIRLNKIKSLNGDQFLADVEKALSFYVMAKKTNWPICTTKDEILFVADSTKIKYSMIDNGSGGFLFVVE